VGGGRLGVLGGGGGGWGGGGGGGGGRGNNETLGLYGQAKELFA